MPEEKNSNIDSLDLFIYAFLSVVSLALLFFDFPKEQPEVTLGLLTGYSVRSLIQKLLKR